MFTARLCRRAVLRDRRRCLLRDGLRAHCETVTAFTGPETVPAVYCETIAALTARPSNAFTARRSPIVRSEAVRRVYCEMVAAFTVSGRRVYCETVAAFTDETVAAFTARTWQRLLRDLCRDLLRDRRRVYCETVAAFTARPSPRLLRDGRRVYCETVNLAFHNNENVRRNY